MIVVVINWGVLTLSDTVALWGRLERGLIRWHYITAHWHHCYGNRGLTDRTTYRSWYIWTMTGGLGGMWPTSRWCTRRSKKKKLSIKKPQQTQTNFIYLGVNGLALGFKTNSFAFGFSVDFFNVFVTFSKFSCGETDCCSGDVCCCAVCSEDDDDEEGEGL